MVKKKPSGGSSPRSDLQEVSGKSGMVQTALYEIADAVSAVTDMQKFYAALHRIVGKLMFARNFYITLYDPDTQMISAPYFTDEAGDVLPSQIRLEKSNKSLRAYVLETGETLHLSGREIEAGRLSGRFTPMGTPAEDWVGVPLKMSGKVIGSVTVQSYQKGVFYDEQDVQVLEFVAQHIAVALTRARLIDETRQRNAELQMINSVQQKLASRLEMQAIYDLVGDKIRAVFGEQAQTVFFACRDSTRALVEFPYFYQMDGLQQVRGWLPERLLARAVIEPYERIFIQSEADLARYVMTGADVRSAILVPLIIGTDVCGVAGVLNHEREYAYQESDVHLIETLVNAMSVALDNARLWEQEKIYRKALERELEIGREMQAGFLPEVLPLVEGWEIAALLMSAREVAGDFYDAFELPDGAVALVIADVCDKGVGAALFMTLFRSLIRITTVIEPFDDQGQPESLLSTADRLQRAVSLTNDYIAQNHGESGMFATVFFGILDPRNGKLTYINGGHEPPLVIHPGGLRQSLPPTGPAVGAIAGFQFNPREAWLQAGDLLFSFTDGLPDAQNAEREFFGRDRLMDLLGRTGSSAHQIVDTIEAEMREYIGGAAQYDDLTLLVVRSAGPSR